MNFPRGPVASSHALIWAVVALVLTHHLVAGALAGFFVYGLVDRTTAGLSPRFLRPSRARPVALLLVFLGSLGLMTLLGRWVFHFTTDLKFAQVLPQMAEVITRMRLNLPDFILVYLPTSPESLKLTVVHALKIHSEALSRHGMEGVAGTVHLIWGMVIGTVLSQFTFAPPAAYRPLSAALLLRLERLNSAFEKVVFAQVRISLLNTTLTACYLLLILPLAGVHLPLAKTLVLLTFVVGLLPVLGNLISNTVIVVISLGVSLEVAAASLAFLVLVHKLEYFLNARIIGRSVSASVWEMLLAMLLMESVFGIAGLVAAPVLYAYLKRELLDADLVGVVVPDQGHMAP
jgi:predicted PurR-regulated permease PerM